MNTQGKPESVQKILSAAHGVIGAGRWGKWEHMNSDVVVDEALNAVNKYFEAGEWS